jgi:hypothetical protein
MVAVRLCDVAPDGTSALISYGLLNLAHRQDHAFPKALVPGRFYEVTLRLKPIAQVVPKGHVLRLAISSAYWPMAWPSPRKVRLEIDPGECVVELPMIEKPGRSRVKFEEPEHAEPGSIRVSVPARESREIRHEVGSQRTVFHIESDDGRYVIEDTGTEIASKRVKIYEIDRDAPASAVTRVFCSQEYRRGDWNPRVETEVTVTCDETHFHISGRVRAFEGGEPFAARDFKESIARDHV